MNKSGEENKYYLTPIEAIRVSSVLESAIEKLHLLTMLSQDISASELSEKVQRKDDPNSENQTTVGSILEEQQKLGKRYEELSSKRGNDLKMSKEESERRENELKGIFKQLKDNTKILCRNLKETPNETSNWKKIRKERNDVLETLESLRDELISGVVHSVSSYSGNLRSSLSDDEEEEEKEEKEEERHYFSPSHHHSRVTYDSFLNKIREGLDDKKFLEEIITREKKNQEEVRRLRKEVEEERRMKDEEIAKKTAEMTNLMNRLRSIKQESEEKYDKHVSTERAKFECNRRIQQAEIMKLDEEYRKLSIQLDIEKRVFEETKHFLEDKNKNLEDHSKKWREKLETEREKMKEQVQEWRERSDDKARKKQRLEIDFRTEIHEKEQREKREEERRNEREQERKEREYRSANRIILAWKCYKDRQLFDEMFRPKKRKKGKGKKKKS